jgi:dimethylamine/trimethylamine dehydrogenase
MTTPTAYAPLFEPLRIGPVTARNRFYQAPHCNGMGRQYPSSMARMRGTKAEGGWAIVCTEQCDVHWTSDTLREIRLWDDRDIPYLARMVEEVHRYGSLAAIELTHMGYYGRNLFSREPTMSPSGQAPATTFPGYARAMDKEDIRNVRRWHRNAALRAKKAGYDCVVVYAGHNLSLAMHFLARRHNRRTDEYGGGIENRARLLRELIEDTKEAIGDTCGVIVRFAVDELMGPKGICADSEGREVIELLGELPDLWDVNCSDWDNDSITARFAEEGFQEPYVSFVKKLTTKPVVGVGRYTSPDRMVSLLKRGVFDMIGAARPSIADPFLPEKIRTGRIEDIRECIGCNICVSYANQNVPMRCTQNPTVGEEWRRGWHPERIERKDTDDTVLVVGAGPAGLEAAMQLGKRGYDVILAEAGSELGGRVTREARLPGLSTWGRVRDYRAYQISQMGNVQVFRESRLDAAQVLEMRCSLVAVATGAVWRRDGVGRQQYEPVPIDPGAKVFTPDDVMAGAAIPGPVVVYDSEQFYMGGVIAEALRAQGLAVTLVTPGAVASAWTEHGLEQGRIQERLHEIGVEIVPLHTLAEAGPHSIAADYAYARRRREIACASVVLVTTPAPDDRLFRDLAAREGEWKDHGVRKVVCIGDCLSPNTIAQAVWSGHRFARTLGENGYAIDEVPFKREIMQLSAEV